MKAPTFLASLVYLTAVLSYPLSDKSGSVKGLTDEYVNATVINTGFVKRDKQTLSSVIGSINGVVEQLGGKKRAEFTQAVVETLWNNNKHYNYVICHVDHDYTFDGTQGTDWDHHQVSVAPGNSASSLGFDIVVGGAGKFIRQGDGGNINWAYKGYVASRNDFDSKVAIVVFDAPP